MSGVFNGLIDLIVILCLNNEWMGCQEFTSLSSYRLSKNVHVAFFAVKPYIPIHEFGLKEEKNRYFIPLRLKRFTNCIF